MPETQPLPGFQALKTSSAPRKGRAKKVSQPGPPTLESESKQLSTDLQRVPRNPSPSLALPRKDYLLKREHVSKEALAQAPRITDILKEVRGGLSLAIKALRFSEEQTSIAFLEKWDSFGTRDQQALGIEGVALAANLNIKHLWGEMMLAIREHSVNSVKIIAVAAHPMITKKRVEFAKTAGGVRDRDALDTMLGALPKSQGISIFNKIVTGGKDEDSEREEMVEDANFIFPDSSIMQDKVQPVRQKILEAK